MDEETIRQRSTFQFDLYKLNVSILGAIMAFSILHSEWHSLLLVCPVISAVLFILWFHYGISIVEDNRSVEGLRPRIKRIRRYSFAVAVLTNFILFPLGAVGLYYVKSVPKPNLLVPLGLMILLLCAGLFVIWYLIHYHGMWINENEGANNANSADAKKPRG